MEHSDVSIKSEIKSMCGNMKVTKQGKNTSVSVCVYAYYQCFTKYDFKTVYSTCKIN